MSDRGFLVRLDTVTGRSGEFILTSPASRYPVTVQPERSHLLSDLLRRLRIVMTGRDDPSGEFTPLALMREVGIWLWKALLPDSAPLQERTALAQALRDGLSPLLLTIPDALNELPWELLYDPGASDERGFLSQRRPLLRFLPSEAHPETPPNPITPPLRVLVLISSPPSLGEDSRVDVESERAAIEEATREAREAGSLHLLIEDIVTLERVQQALTRFKPHILHFIGHGGYDENHGGFLLWEDEQGKEVPFSDVGRATVNGERGQQTTKIYAHFVKPSLFTVVLPRRASRHAFTTTWTACRRFACVQDGQS